MFELKEKYGNDRKLYSIITKRISTMNTLNSQIYIILPGEGSVISLLNSCIHLSSDVIHAATNTRHTDGIDIRLVNLK